jgi:uncharacterized protein YdeI (YjbR/CyaY-like superfamily)
VDIGKTLDVPDRRRWRAWLEKHHDSEPEIWLVYHTKASKKPSISYNDAVEEALCFGWIDSTNKKHGPDSRAQRFTPRRPKSPLSEMNKVRIRRLHAAGLMTEAGLAAAPGVLDETFEVPPDILAALRADKQTWSNFEAFPDSYKRIRVGWINAARRRPAVFEQRLAYFLKMTARNKRFGMVQ